MKKGKKKGASKPAVAQPPNQETLRTVTRSMMHNCAPGAKCDYVALHDMNHTTVARREAFLQRVALTYSKW